MKALGISLLGTAMPLYKSGTPEKNPNYLLAAQYVWMPSTVHGRVHLRLVIQNTEPICKIFPKKT